MSMSELIKQENHNNKEELSSNSYELVHSLVKRRNSQTEESKKNREILSIKTQCLRSSDETIRLKAQEDLEELARSGNLIAADILADYLFELKDYKKAMQWLEIPASNNSPIAIEKLQEWIKKYPEYIDGRRFFKLCQDNANGDFFKLCPDDAKGDKSKEIFDKVYNVYPDYYKKIIEIASIVPKESKTIYSLEPKESKKLSTAGGETVEATRLPNVFDPLYLPAAVRLAESYIKQGRLQDALNFYISAAFVSALFNDASKDSYREHLVCFLAIYSEHDDPLDRLYWETFKMRCMHSRSKLNEFQDVQIDASKLRTIMHVDWPLDIIEVYKRDRKNAPKISELDKNSAYIYKDCADILAGISIHDFDTNVSSFKIVLSLVKRWSAAFRRFKSSNNLDTSVFPMLPLQFYQACKSRNNLDIFFFVLDRVSPPRSAGEFVDFFEWLYAMAGEINKSMGNAEANYFLGYVYSNGVGVSINLGIARTHWESAFGLGHQEAGKALETLPVVTVSRNTDFFAHNFVVPSLVSSSITASASTASSISSTTELPSSSPNGNG
jgi:hypothetical protein